MRPALAVGAVLFAAGFCERLAAQDSQFGILGLGTPGRTESVRARTTGGAFAAVDPLSPLVDAALADVRRVAASAAGATSYRAAELDGASVALRSSRFPLLTIAGPLGRRWALGGGFSTYLDKSYRVETRDTIVLRGNPEPVTDRVASDGAVTDLRVAVAARPLRRVALGVGLHVLAGSTRESVTREFDSDIYGDLGETQDVRYDGLGGSASVLADVVPGLRAAAWIRADTRLRTRVGDAETARHDLPLEVGAAVRLQFGPTARAALSAARRTWEGATPNAFDTFTWAVGAELARPSLPLRLGIRRAELPFGPGGEAPTEFVTAAGTGFGFSEGRAVVDLGIERARRDGTGLRETVWTVLVGITVVP